jgi:hypothetical protein
MTVTEEEINAPFSINTYGITNRLTEAPGQTRLILHCKERPTCLRSRYYCRRPNHVTSASTHLSLLAVVSAKRKLDFTLESCYQLFYGLRTHAACIFQRWPLVTVLECGCMYMHEHYTQGAKAGINICMVSHHIVYFTRSLVMHNWHYFTCKLKLSR